MSKLREICDYLVFYIKRYGAKFVRWFKRNALPILLLTIFCILIGLFSYFYYNDPDFELISYLSGFSSVFVAILTLFYVLTTSKQLSVMNKQLKQMENDSKQTKKALLFLNNTELITQLSQLN